MAYQCIQYGVSQRVATITLDRPESLNAFSDELNVELVSALKEAEADDEIRCVILTGAGRAFSAGADIKGWNRSLEKADEQESHVVIPNPESTPFGDVILGLTKPVIAAVNGMAIGVGATITLTCDIRLASDKARFAFSFVKRGLVAEIGSTFLLPRLVGYGMAKELFLTGRFVESQEAKEIGLVNAVYPAGELMSRTLEMAQTIAASPALAVRFLKQGLNLSLDSSYRDIRLFERWAMDSLRQSEDYKEAVRSFVEKRPAVFKGR